MANLNQLNKIHRMLGFTAAAFVVLLSVTGVALNHSDGLSLTDTQLPNWLLENVYGVEGETYQDFAISGLDLQLRNGRQLHVGGAYVARCSSGVVAAFVQVGNIVVACQNDLVFLTEQGELIEHLDALKGLPTPVLRVGHAVDQLAIQSEAGLWLFEVNSGMFSQVAHDLIRPEWQPSLLANASAGLEEGGQSQAEVHELSLERFLLDLHSGRLVGGWGVWLIDFVALSLVVLTITGYQVWKTKRDLFAD